MEFSINVTLYPEFRTWILNYNPEVAVRMYDFMVLIALNFEFDEFAPANSKLKEV